jgi:putative transposase
MIDRTHDLPISRQVKALNISRGAAYYNPRPVSAEDLAIMRRLDELHLEHPFMGARMLRDMLNREEVKIGRRHAGTLMKRMGINAIYQRPNTSKPSPGCQSAFNWDPRFAFNRDPFLGPGGTTALAPAQPFG